MLHVTLYLKSGAVAEFEAASIEEAAAEHPKFALGFTPPEQGGRRLVYLDRDDVSAVVVREGGASGAEQAAAAEAAEAEEAVEAAEALIRLPEMDVSSLRTRPMAESQGA